MAKKSVKTKAPKTLSVAVHRTAGFAVRRSSNPNFVLACEALMRAGRALENSTTFLLRNFKSAYKDGVLKEELHENESSCVEAMDRAVQAFLARKKPELDMERASAQASLAHAEASFSARESKDKKVSKHVEDAKSKLAKIESKIASLPRRLGDRPGNKGAFGANLAANISIVDLAYRELTHLKSDGSRGHALQKALPSAMATGCRESVEERFKAHGEALKEWFAHPEKFKGRPQMPGYHGKGELATLRIQSGALGKNLPTIAAKPLFLDDACMMPLPEAAIQAWGSTSVDDIAAKLSGMLPKQSGGKAKGHAGSKGKKKASKIEVGRMASMRFVPEPEGVRIEAVFECHVPVEAASPMGKFIAGVSGAEAGKAAKKQSSSGKRPKKDGSEKFHGFEISKHRQQILSSVKSHGPGELSRTAGLDMGLVNAAAIAFGSGRPAVVISGKAIEAELAKIEVQLESALSKATSIRMRELQALEASETDAGRQLALPLWKELKSLRSAIESNAEVQRLRALRKRRQKALAHRLASAIVAELVGEGIQTLCIGKNDYWKQSSGKGKAFNKRMHGIPHAAIIEALLHKCLEASILAVQVDEAYSSKCSFALGEAFPDLKTIDLAEPSQPIGQPPEPFLKHKEKTKNKTGSKSPAFAGIRVQDPGSTASHAPKNCFETPGLKDTLDGWGKVHADANGAYNIVRRACPAFKVHAKLSPRFGLFWLSPCGLRALGQKASPKLKDRKIAAKEDAAKAAALAAA